MSESPVDDNQPHESTPAVATAEIVRDPFHRVQVNYHRSMIALASVVLLASLLLSTDGPTEIRLPASDRPLPSMCHFKTLTGHDCPGCGLTRCFVAMAHGHVVLAWKFHPVGAIFFWIVLAQIPWRFHQLRRLARNLEETRLPFASFVLWFLAIGLPLQWIVRLSSR